MPKAKQAAELENPPVTSGRPSHAIDNPTKEEIIHVINQVIIKLEQLTGRVEQLELDYEYDRNVQ